MYCEFDMEFSTYSCELDLLLMIVININMPYVVEIPMETGINWSFINTMVVDVLVT